MGEWTRACELTSDTKDTLMSEYLEREFHPMGKAGEWQCVVGLTRFNGHGFKSSYAAFWSRSSYVTGLT